MFQNAMDFTKPDKICWVCGDKAIAINFCAISCESCKAFFRRNASKTDEFKCISTERCKVNVKTRRNCRKCRIKKCYRMGMRQEGIWSEDQKQERNRKIEENRKRKLELTIEDNPSLQSSGSTISVIAISDSEENEDNVIPLKSNVEEEPNSNQSVVEIYTNFVPIGRQLRDNTFNELESIRFKELIETTDKFLTINCSYITLEVTTLLDALRIGGIFWDREIRKVIKVSKSLSTFKDLCEDDKLTLIKYGSVEIAFLRSICYYNKQSEYLYVFMNERDTALVYLMVFKQRSNENYESFKMFFNNLSQELGMDYHILHLLFAILLFNPNRPQLIHRPVVRLQQQVYIHLLKRYLQLRYRSESEVKSRFNRFMNILCDVHDIHEKHVRSYLEEDKEARYMFMCQSPLLKELYDNWYQSIDYKTND